MSTRLTEYADRRVWDLTGLEVCRVCCARTLDVLLCGNADGIEIRFETELSLRSADGGWPICPNHTADQCRMLELLGSPARRLTVRRDGMLTIELESSVLEGPTDATYGSWEITDGAGAFEDLRMSCKPDGMSPWGGPRASDPTLPPPPG